MNTQSLYTDKVHQNMNPIRTAIDKVRTVPHQEFKISTGLYRISPRERILKTHSSLSLMLANGYLLAEKFFGYHEAETRIKNADELLRIADLKLSVSDDEICQFADDKARNCQLKLSNLGYTFQCYERLLSYVRIYHINPPKLDDDEFIFVNHDDLTVEQVQMLTGAINRICDPIWWRRALRKKQAFVIEQLARDLRLVHKKASAYVSQHTISNKRDRVARTDELLDKLFVVPNDSNIFGDFESLKSIADKSHTSGEQQAAELMVRIRGFEEVAKMSGHSAEFYTFTAPSRFHSSLASGIPNKKYQGLSPKDAQNYFNNIWKLARARFAKQDIRPYGFRVVEPHHDGCPHWHMLLFVEKGQSVKVRKILKELLCADTPNEFVTTDTRFKAVHIDPKKGSAAGYIAKYITKAVTGNHIKYVECPISGKIKINPADAAERASIWSSTFDIRRFQQIGGPSITVWRELRMLGQGIDGQIEVANSMNIQLDDSIANYALEKVRAAADSSDWAAFCLAMGGVQVKRKDQTARVHYQIPDVVDSITGEISRSEKGSPLFVTKYGDIPAKRILGVAWDTVLVITRRGSSQIVTERDLATQRKIMAGVKEAIDNWVDDGRWMLPPQSEIDFLNSVIAEDYQNMCLFLDAESLDIYHARTSVARLDLCH